MKLNDLIGKTISGFDLSASGLDAAEDSQFCRLGTYAGDNGTRIHFTDGTSCDLTLSDPGVVYVELHPMEA